MPGPAKDPSPASRVQAMRKIVLLPVFNEGPSLPTVLEGLALSADAIIAVDDGSRDNSADILRAWAATNCRVTLVSLPRNLGKSEALGRGFRRIKDMLDRGMIGPGRRRHHHGRGRADPAGDHRPGLRRSGGPAVGHAHRRQGFPALPLGSSGWATRSSPASRPSWSDSPSGIRSAASGCSGPDPSSGSCPGTGRDGSSANRSSR